MTRKVIDTNFFENSELKRYLEASRKNIIVLTDCNGIELFKSADFYHVAKKIKILSRYADQVCVLKRIDELHGLKPREAGFQNRMICKIQTTEFKKFCNVFNVASDAVSSGRISGFPNIKHYTRAAKMHLSVFQAHIDKIPDLLSSVASLYTASELKVIRSDREWSDALIRKVARDVMLTGARMLAAHKSKEDLPKKLNDAIHTFAFRYGVMCHIWMMDRIISGAIDNVKSEKTVSDLMDCNYAAYASCFDGILTSDEKMKGIYIEGMRWLGLFKKNGSIPIYLSR